MWRIIHRILKPNQQPLRQDPDKLNSFFACTAKRTLPVSSDLPFCLEELIESLPEKTKTMLLSTSQMSHVHSLDKNRPAITISDSTLEYVNVSKLLGVHFHQHLNWDEHVQATCKSCYGTIQMVRKLKNFARVIDSESS